MLKSKQYKHFKKLDSFQLYKNWYFIINLIKLKFFYLLYGYILICTYLVFLLTVFKFLVSIILMIKFRNLCIKLVQRHFLIFFCPFR
jgi:hypothetical protein